MACASYIAGVFGPFLFIFGLWMLLYSKNFHKIVTGLKGTPALFFVTGLINLILGLAIINTYNQWSLDLGIFVTLLGWFLAIRGASILFVPQLVIKYTMSKEKFLSVMGFIPFIWGLILCWFAFWVK